MDLGNVGKTHGGGSMIKFNLVVKSQIT